MYNYSKAKIKISLEIDKIMKKLENTYQDASLIKKALLGDASDEEQLVLEQRLSEHPELKTVYEKLQDSEELKDSFNKYKEYSSEKAYEHFLQQIQQKENPSDGKIRRIRTWWYAAAAMVVLAVGISFYAVNHYQAMEDNKARIALIEPGSKQAVLTLPDGSTIDVQKKDINVIVDGVQVKYNKGVLSYRPTVTTQQHAEKNVDESPAKSNELVIPRGGENTVLLADGTTVHLNAGSKLIYPARFVGKRRIVTLEGEAYFEIAENKKSPFQVLAENVKIQVTGTCFNVKAYASDKVIKTTLDEGSINIGHVQSRRPMQQMLPGQTAVYEKRSNVIKIKTDRYHDDASSWKSNRLIFRNASLKEVLTTLSRHFDIEITVKNEKIASFTYDFVCKGNDLNYVLEVMQSITPVSFKKISEYTYTVE